MLEFVCVWLFHLDSMKNITEIINNKRGDFVNQEIYHELEKLARFSLYKLPANGTLNTKDVVHESILKVYKLKKHHFQSRGHFYSLVSSIMRNLIVDYVRKKHAKSSSGSKVHVTLSNVEQFEQETDTETAKLLSIESAIKKLGAVEKTLEEIVVMHFYGGVSLRDIAKYLDTSESTIKRKLLFAKTTLKVFMSEEEASLDPEYNMNDLI